MKSPGSTERKLSLGLRLTLELMAVRITKQPRLHEPYLKQATRREEHEPLHDHLTKQRTDAVGTSDPDEEGRILQRAHPN